MERSPRCCLSNPLCSNFKVFTHCWSAFLFFFLSSVQRIHVVTTGNLPLMAVVPVAPLALLRGRLHVPSSRFSQLRPARVPSLTSSCQCPHHVSTERRVPHVMYVMHGRIRMKQFPSPRVEAPSASSHSGRRPWLLLVQRRGQFQRVGTLNKRPRTRRLAPCSPGLIISNSLRNVHRAVTFKNGASEDRFQPAAMSLFLLLFPWGGGASARVG